MNTTLAKEYKARSAKVYVHWEEAEEQGLVRWQCEPEFLPIEDLMPDFSDSKDPKADKAEWLDLVRREGIWIYATQYRIDETRRWETADGIGGIEGSIKGTGYDVDLMQAALDALDRARQEEADKLAARATLAGVL
jgi:hypothetical protein